MMESTSTVKFPIQELQRALERWRQLIPPMSNARCKVLAVREDTYNQLKAYAEVNETNINFLAKLADIEIRISPWLPETGADGKRIVGVWLDDIILDGVSGKS